jgi:hypothetical protein
MIIYFTNHRNPEKDLLSKENLRQTLRLILANAFTDSEADRKITAVVQDIFARCPSLFSTILPRSELGSDTTLEEDDEDERHVWSDNAHQQVSVIGCKSARYCREQLLLPTRASQMESSFRVALRDAYGADYGMPNIAQFDVSTFQWCKKLSFFDNKTQRRVTLQDRDFTRVKRGNTEGIVRIDHIFIHNWDNQRRVFIRATEVNTTPSYDGILGCQILGLQPEKTTTIGLPAIGAERLYIIPVAEDPIHPATANGRVAKLKLGGPESRDLLWIDRSLEWL